MSGSHYDINPVTSLKLEGEVINGEAHIHAQTGWKKCTEAHHLKCKMKFYTGQHQGPLEYCCIKHEMKVPKDETYKQQLLAALEAVI